MIDYAALKMKVGKKPIYLFHKMEQAVVRVMDDPNVRCFAKFKGKKEYEVDYYGEMVGEAFENPIVITKVEYDNW